MVTSIKGTIQDFKRAVQLMSGMKSNKDMLFNQVVMVATKGLIKSMSFFKGGGIFSISEFNNFDVDMGDDNEMEIPIDVVEFMECLKIGSSNDLIEVTYDGKTMLITFEMDVVNIPGITIKSIDNHRKNVPWKTDKGGNPMFDAGKDPMTTTIKMDASIFKGILERSKITGTEYFPLEFRKPDKLIAQCGDEKDRKNKSIKHTRDDIIINGNDLKIVMSQGFDEVFNVLSGDITIMGRSSTHPLWIVKETSNYKACYFLAPLKDTS